MLFRWLFSLVLIFHLACAAAPLPRAPHQAASVAMLGRWADDAYPLDLRLSEDLEPCQRAGVLAAAAWWHSRTGRTLWIPRDVPRNDLGVLGQPPYRVVAVTPGEMSRPHVLDEAWLWRPGATKQLIHSVQIVVQGCHVQAYTHELGHSLGLDHRHDPDALMHPIYHGDRWGLSEAEIRAVIGGW